MSLELTRMQWRGGNAPLIDALARALLSSKPGENFQVCCRTPEKAQELLQAVIARAQEIQSEALPLPEVARRARISEATLRRWASSGKVRAWKTPKGNWLVDAGSLPARREGPYEVIEDLKG